MKTSSALALLLSWIALGVGGAHPARAAEGSSTGSITGRVQNVATGQYLNNARVSIKGTGLIAFTDPFGVYCLNQAPAGRVVVEVFFTGLDPQEISLDLAAGATVERDIALTSVARYGARADTVKLDPFLVEAGRETNAGAIATNEQRFAPNLKNVISTDALGPQFVGGAGEFLKAIPGVVVDYDTVEARAVSLRGIGGNMTSFMTDGAEMINANVNAATRTFQGRSLSLADIARVEVSKVPLPSKPADSLAGNINFIRKNAFERTGAEFTYGLALVANTKSLTLRRESQVNVPSGRLVHRVRPGVEFSYTQPVGKNFGFVLTGSHVDRYSRQYQSRTTWNSVGTGINATVAHPYLQQYLTQDGDRHTINDLVSLKADWRIARHSTLSVGASHLGYTTNIVNQQFFTDPGTIGTPTVAGGTAFSFSPDFTHGATGRGNVGSNSNGVVQDGPMATANINYRLDDGTWRIEAGVSGSESTFYRSGEGFPEKFWGFFNAVLIAPVRVTLGNFQPFGPRQLAAFDNNNAPVDIYDRNNYRITTSQENVQYNTMDGRNAFADVRRAIGAARFPFAVQVGGSYRYRVSDIRQKTDTYNYNGPDGDPTTLADQGAARFATAPRKNGFGFVNLPFFSPTAGFAAWQANPRLFSQTPAQLVAAEVTRLTNSEHVEEKVSAGYAQAEAGLFRNRLRVLTGARFERTVSSGEGSLFDPNAVFGRNGDGTFARNAQGARIRKPEAGATGSMEELRLTRRERAAKNTKSYDGWYPSLHLTLSLSENLLARVAYAQTYGRPDFANLIPRTVVTEADLTTGQLADPSVARGTLNVRNPSLQPWSADNYDLSLEFYSASGGMLTASFFQKDLKNFFGTATRRATAADLDAVGLDAQYVGWDLTTTFNAGGARIRGAELGGRHSLAGLGAWGSHLVVFANATKLLLDGNPGANFTTFLPKSANWGLSFNRRQIAATVRWNYRGLDKRDPIAGFGPDGNLYYSGRTVLDINLTYKLTSRLSLVGMWNNVTDQHIGWYRYGSQTPGYARQWQEQEFGSMISVGVEGRF